MRSAVGLVASIAVAVALSGCTSATAIFKGSPPETFDLSAPRDIPKLRRGTAAQILIPEASAIKTLDSDRIVVTTGNRITYYPDAQWPDRLPKLVQAKAIEAFDKSGRVRAVGRPGEGLSIDYQVLTDIRAFQFAEGGGVMTAQIEIFARIMNDRNGRIVASRLFTALVPVAENTAPGVVAALDTALGKVLVDLVRWTLTRV